MEANKVRLHYLPNLFYLRALIAGAAGLWLAAFSADASAQEATRLFPMTILSSTDNVYNAGVDIPTFSQNVFSNKQGQPKGHSIAWLPLKKELDLHTINWKQIVAVYVDEPYDDLLRGRDSCDDAAIQEELQRRMNEAAAMAAAVRARAPRARFWVNFSINEVELMINPYANCHLNQPYIDVISLDWYGRSFFPDIHERYEYLYQNRATPYQQLALVPGTFTWGHAKQSGAEGAARLKSHFSYAYMMNEEGCNLPLGPTGKTGYYDGCPVWMVAGWMGGVEPLIDYYDVEKRYPYYPIDNPGSIRVFEQWQEEFFIPPTRQPVSSMRKLVPLLFE